MKKVLITLCLFVPAVSWAFDVACTERDQRLSNTDSEKVVVEKTEGTKEIGIKVYFPKVYEGRNFSGALLGVGVSTEDVGLMAGLQATETDDSFYVVISVSTSLNENVFVSGGYGSCISLGRIVHGT